MSYAKSDRALNRIKPVLDLLVAADKDVRIPSDNPHMLGYYIREGFKIARDRKLTQYKDLPEKFVIRNRGDHVLAELRSRVTLTALQQHMSRVVLDEIVDLVQVIGAAIQHKAEEMQFPDAELERDDLLRLYQWASKNQYYLIVAETGLTLTKDDPGEAKWTPE